MNQPSQLSPHYARELIDDIVYMASLVSRYEAVDPLLDKMRAVTATQHINTRPSEEDITVLQTVKSQIECYLVEQEPTCQLTFATLRAVTKQRRQAPDA